MSSKAQRIGIFGGAFDPPHQGHFAVASAALKQAELDEVIWIPTFSPAHRAASSTTFELRLEMACRAIEDEPKFSVSNIESRLPTPSFTLQTIMALKKERHPHSSFFVILGADQWTLLDTWFSPEKLVKEAEFLIYPREGNEIVDRKGSQVLQGNFFPPASHHLRTMLQQGKFSAISEISPAVLKTIHKHGLYGTDSSINLPSIK